MKQHYRLSAAQRRAIARAPAARLMNALRAEGLDVCWLMGSTPVLSDGKLTPPEVLAARYPLLAARLGELLVAPH